MWKELTNLWKSDNLLVEAWEESYEMLEIAQEMFLEAVRILRESDDMIVNWEIRRKDKKVNAYERNVRRKVMTHCTLQGPTVLPSGMVLVSIVIDIERIGDYCKNILDLAEVHPQHLSVPTYEEALAGIEEKIKKRFNTTINVLKNQDVEKARAMMSTFKEEISAICDQIDDELVKGTVEEISPGDSAALALYSRYLKRISAHLNNMISSVVNPFDRIGFIEEDS
mgnify:CR=1 FL=1|jgi:phosphate uptake regulator